MGIGGGTFLSQNKVLPGTYINVVSAASASVALSDRGTVAMALSLPWGPIGELITVTGEDLLRRSRSLFGREYTHPDLLPLRELFAGARVAHLFRLGASGTRASCELGTAVYPGSLGNQITLIITQNAGGFGVETLVDGVLVDHQAVTSSAELRGNGFVTFDPEAVLVGTAGLSLAGGSDGVPTVDEYSRFLDLSERVRFHTMGCLATDNVVKAMFARHTKRMREEVGVKFQCVLYRYPEADYEGIISVENAALGADALESGLVYWAAGMSAGCAVNRSLTNRRYTGELTVDTGYTQRELEQKLKGGNFLFHGAGNGDVRVVEDVNTLTTYSVDRSEDFSLNQTMRVIDQVATDIAALFANRYLGIIPNDNAGRLGLWSDIVSHHRRLETIRAIEDFEPGDVTVEAGESKRSVVVTDRITPVAAMSQLYMTVVVQ
ncbi:MAG: phage tail sheath family protein [Oscillospiraceae bacterium]|nr:phage tail sheath family protein [Oscillospiraceae bacterium]